MSNFNERLKLLRKERDYTQDQLANLLGISRSSLAMYEQGRRKPDFETLEAMADLFNVDIDYLLGTKDTTTFLGISLATNEMELIRAFRELNDEGQQRAISYISDLSEMEKYTEKEKTSLGSA